MPEIMTPEQVAAYLQLSTDSVYRLIRRKELAASTIGRRYRIHKADLDHFLRTRSSGHAAREALIQRVLAVGARNPNTNSDDVLDELERMDEERRRGVAE